MIVKSKNEQIAERHVESVISIIFVVIFVTGIVGLFWWMYSAIGETGEPAPGVKTGFLIFDVLLTVLFTGLTIFAVRDNVLARKNRTLISLSLDKKVLIIHYFYRKNIEKNLDSISFAEFKKPNAMIYSSPAALAIGAHKKGLLKIIYFNESGQEKILKVKNVLDVETVVERINLIVRNRNK